MDGWKPYIRLFDRLTPDEQRDEWNQLTEAERRQVEARRVSNAEVHPSDPQSVSNPPRLRTVMGILGAIVLFALLCAVGISLHTAATARRAEARAEEVRREQEAARDETIRRYRENSTSILSEANDAMNSGKFEDAIAIIKPFLVTNEADVIALHERAVSGMEASKREEQVGQLLARIESSSKENFVLRRDLYRQLVELDPSEPKYAEQVELYSSKINKQQEQFRREQEQSRLAQKWRYGKVADEMTGRSTSTASITSENSVSFDFPYQGDQHATLTLRDHPSYGRDVIFRIEQGQILCTTYDRCNVRVRFDDGPPQTWTANPAADHSTTVIFLGSYANFLRRMRGAEVVRIQPEIYQEGSPIFEFRVGGYDHDQYLSR